MHADYLEQGSKQMVTVEGSFIANATRPVSASITAVKRVKFAI